MGPWLPQGPSLSRISFLAAVYPAGIAQADFPTAQEADNRRWNGGPRRRHLSHRWVVWTRRVAAVVQGLSAATVYPMLVAFYGRPRTRDVANAPAGFCRPWPDVEYAAGANPAGMLVDLFGIRSAIATVGGVALLSAPIVATAMYETAACRRED